ncbi:hypothetical protein HDV05_001870 [Chytridiales sp. JEL 0842]|nr:hypothetical protein HDV05_001870 [Chytridiales sp. JEL 0842]
MDLIYSAAIKRSDDIHIFTNFSFLKSNEIMRLLWKWVKHIYLEEQLNVLEEIAFTLQGRPRLLASFLHRLIEYNGNISEAFDSYVSDMTTGCNSALENSSPYFFWQHRIGWTIEPIVPSTDSDLQRRQVSDFLVKLCVHFLLGDGTHIPFSDDLNLVSTSLVMVRKSGPKWHACMAEPMVLRAGVNFLASRKKDFLMEYFAKFLFAPLATDNLTPQERGNMMELVIAIRFVQGWWLEDGLRNFLPGWAKIIEIPKPRGVLDCRVESSDINYFLQQLRNPAFPWILLPPVNAGPDLRYSVFSCYIKTTYTANSSSTMFVSAGECRKNVATMDPSKWYQNEPQVQGHISDEVPKQRFIHMRFELPDTAPSMKAEFQSGPSGVKDYQICVSLDSEFARNFFGEYFVDQYKTFILRQCALR